MQLEPLLSRLTIDVPSAADVPDLEIKRDGNVVRRAAWGSGIPVDPGDHLIEASAPGKLAWRQTVVLNAQADSKRVVVPVLEPAPTVLGARPPQRVSNQAPGPLAPPTEAAEATVASRVRAAPPPRAQRPARTEHSGVPGLISIGVGVAAVGVGSYFGVRAIRDKNDADRECASGCMSTGAHDNAEAIKFANLSTIGFGVGVVGVGLGVIWLFAHGGSHAAETTVRVATHAPTFSITGLSVGREGAGVGVSSHW